MQNEDDQCIKWSVTRALNSKEMPTVKELRQLAKERGLKGYSELNKAELLKELKVEVEQNPHRIDKKLQEQAEELNYNVLTSPLAGKISTNLKRLTRRFP